MPRINQRPQSPAVTRPTTPATPRSRSATSPSASATTGAWGTRGTRPAQRPALLSRVATIQTPDTQAIGPAKLPSNTIAGVPVRSATELQFQGLTGANPLMTRTLDVRFGKLSQPQFDALKQEFGGLSQVKYDAAREYTAVDFLPPVMQGLVGRDLDPGNPVKVPGSARFNNKMNEGVGGRGDLEIGSTPNCHGTAWEMMRAYQNPTSPHVHLLYGDAQLAGPAYENAERFESLGKAAADETPAFLKDLRPGDVVTFRQGEYTLLHSAVYVGGGLFFEKPDTESDQYDESPYRLVTYDQAVAPIAEFLGGPPSAEALRPRGALPPGTEAFSTGEDAQKFEAWAATKGLSVGKQLVREMEVGMGGGIRGLHFNAVETRRVEIGADGRGVVR